MERFTLVHDGSAQGWRTAYLTFHIAGRLGALLQVLLATSIADDELLSQTASQVEIGGRAAGVAIETHILPDPSVETIIENLGETTGLFLPSRLVPDMATAARLIGAAACPLWIVSEESTSRTMAVLVEDSFADEDLIAYAVRLAQRMTETLTGLLIGSSPAPADDSRLTWIPLQDSSLPVVMAALDRLQADLLLLRLPLASLARELDCTCVIFPGSRTIN
jgi:hypothetical protein